MTDGIQRMDLNEFIDGGFLQEVNRQFFHPLGLALEVMTDPDEQPRLGGIWDYREDPEGIVFSGGTISQAKVDHVQVERDAHAEARKAMFDGEIVQPVWAE